MKKLKVLSMLTIFVLVLAACGSKEGVCSC